MHVPLKSPSSPPGPLGVRLAQLATATAPNTKETNLVPAPSVSLQPLEANRQHPLQKKTPLPASLQESPSPPDSQLGVVSSYLQCAWWCGVHLVSLPKRKKSKPFEFLQNANVSFYLLDFKRGRMPEENTRLVQNSTT